MAHHPTLSDFFRRLGFIRREDGTKDGNTLNPFHKAILPCPEMDPEPFLGGSEELSFSYKGRMMPPFLGRCALASAVAWVLLALCSASFLYLGKSLFPFKLCGGPPKPPLPDKMDVETALRALDETTSELLRTWDGVSLQTQSAFIKNFLPRDATGKPGEGPLEGIMDGVPGGALAVYLHHVGTVRFLAEGVKRGKKEKRKAALLRRINMVKLIIKLTIQRLRTLDEGGNFAANNKIFSAVNGVELELPTSEELADGGEINYDEYQEMVKGIGAFRSPSDPAATVPWPLAKKLVDTLRLKEMQLNANQNIISSLQIAIPFIYGEDHDWTEDGTGPVKGGFLGPLPVPERPPATYAMAREPLPEPGGPPLTKTMVKGSLTESGGPPLTHKMVRRSLPVPEDFLPPATKMFKGAFSEPQGPLTAGAMVKGPGGPLPTYKMAKGPLSGPPRPTPRGPRPAPPGPLIEEEGLVAPPSEGPPGKEEGEGAPLIPPVGGGEGPTEVPLSYFKQLLHRFSYLLIEEMGRLQRERRLPMDWTPQAAVEHLNEISNSQQEYADAVKGLKDATMKEWETELGVLTPFDLGVVALRLM